MLAKFDGARKAGFTGEIREIDNVALGSTAHEFREFGDGCHVGCKDKPPCYGVGD